MRQARKLNVEKSMKTQAVLPAERRRQHKGLAVLLGYWLVGIIAAYATPDDILTYRWSAAFVDFMGGLVPAVDDVMPSSPIRDVVQFYLAVMWALMPFFIWALYWLSTRGRSKDKDVKMFREKKLFGLFMFLMLAATSYVLYTDADGSNWRERAVLSSRLGVAGMYGIVFDVVLLFYTFMLLWLKYIPAVYFRKD